MRIQYSILRYRPDLYSGESINIGIAFHNMETDERDFVTMKNYKRLWAFDDELDPEFTINSIEEIKDDWISGSLFSDYTYLKDYTKFFVNEFYFSSIKTERISNYKEFINDAYKYFLGKAVPKSERLSKRQKMNFIESFLKENSCNYRKNKKLSGAYNDSFIFDYSLTRNEERVGIKYISTATQSTHMLRSLLFYAEHVSLVKISVMIEVDLSAYNDEIRGLLEMGIQNGLISIVTEDKIDELVGS
ncbi:DUF3037 domain-containing protein [Listeria fleischmannii]|uniref:DUF3037 domain-containing protein n=1 Tax=Listeria fleischmannii FSL S10-1203 TaxID=1265822 RepID=W7DF19_9LIST|nr:DUF3037 domain-containing protein [Listeria fleischmannii]EUJ56609.1 hypothetical protein MCOL2_08786 [Listeria fleischmannii FSL S10-1203]